MAMHEFTEAPPCLETSVSLESGSHPLTYGTFLFFTVLFLSFTLGIYSAPNYLDIIKTFNSTSGTPLLVPSTTVSMLAVDYFFSFSTLHFQLLFSCCATGGILGSQFRSYDAQLLYSLRSIPRNVPCSLLFSLHHPNNIPCALGARIATLYC